MRLLQGRTGPVRCLAYSPDGRTLASGGEDGQVLLWTLPSGSSRALPRPNGGRQHDQTTPIDWVQAVAFAPDGSKVASGSWDGIVRLWQLPRGMGRELGKRTSGIWCLAYSPEGSALAAGSMDGEVQRNWTRNSDRTRQFGPLADGAAHSWNAHQGPVRGILYTPDGKVLITASHDRTIKLWEADWCSTSDVLGQHPDWICCLALSSDGRCLASAGEDGAIRLWDLPRREQVAELIGHEKRISQVAFTRDGRSLISGSWDGTIRLWDVQDRQLRQTLDFQLGRIHCVAVAPDGMTAAVGGGNHAILLWDLDS